MKKLIVVLMVVVVNSLGYSQITIDHIYQGASQKLFMVNLEFSGPKYVEKSQVPGNRYLKFYNLNHSLWKTISCNNFPVMTYCGMTDTAFIFSSLYISENLFDCDSSVEFLYSSYSDCKWFTGVYKEDGTALLIADSTSSFVDYNVPQQNRPIYNTPTGTKMILSHKNGSSVVYNLPCALSSGIDEYLIEDGSSSAAINVYPNPMFYQNTIEYKLPDGINVAEIIITDLSGQVIKKYTVDGNFSNLLIEQNELAPGTYFYSLVANSNVLVSKKIIRLK